jgi:asparagine synthase (glutamine-hydrolysing)
MSNTDNMRVLAIVSAQLLHRQFVVDGGAAEQWHPPEPMLVIDLVADEGAEDGEPDAVRAGVSGARP